MLIETDEGLANLLKTVRHIALVGASHKPERPSYQVLEFLLKKGYRVTPVNPGLAGQFLQGQTVVGSLNDIDTPVTWSMSLGMAAFYLVWSTKRFR